MAVQIQAVLDRATLAQLLAQLTPLIIDLDGDENHNRRWLEIGAPERLELVAGQGIRLRIAARLQWTVLGVPVPVTILSATMRLDPVIADSPSGGRLNLLATLEDADLKHVPELIEEPIVAHINARLAAKQDAFGWDFGQTLTHSIALPAALAPVRSFELGVRHGSVAVDAEALRLSVELPMKFVRAE
jgi:hypothetical protein